MNYDNSFVFNADALRISVNLAQHYDAWIAAARTRNEIGRLHWKTVNGKDYLYRAIGHHGATSLGPRSESTQRLYERFHATSEAEKGLWFRLQQDAMLWRALKLPMPDPAAGQVLRALDVEQRLGPAGVLVAGTHALFAYAVAAGERMPPDHSATDDVDLAWARTDPLPPGHRSLYDILQRLDRTYTLNQERTFQMRNASGYHIDLLISAARTSTVPQHEPLRPLPLEGQDWLLLGTPVEATMVTTDGKPARIVAPDPRYFALHKLWLATQADRTPHKTLKDHEQGWWLLSLTARRLPGHPLDEAFAASVPALLRPFFDHWRDAQTPSPDELTDPGYR